MCKKLIFILSLMLVSGLKAVQAQVIADDKPSGIKVYVMGATSYVVYGGDLAPIDIDSAFEIAYSPEEHDYHFLGIASSTHEFYGSYFYYLVVGGEMYDEPVQVDAFEFLGTSNCFWPSTGCGGPDDALWYSSNFFDPPCDEWPTIGYCPQNCLGPPDGDYSCLYSFALILGMVCEEPPTVEIIKAKMVKIPPAFTESGLGVDLHVEFPVSDDPYQSRYVLLQAVVNGQYINKELDISGLVAAGEAKDILWNAGQFIGEPLIVLDFGAANVPRFEANQKFDLMAEAWTSDGIVDFIVSDPSIRSVEIYLPVVIVHGYLFPETGSRLFGKIVAPAIYTSLANYLRKQDTNMNDQTKEPFITGYTTDESPYQTIWRRNWQESWTPRQVGDWLHRLISDVRSATYAARVNIVGHSMGGLIGRYYASDADGWHPDASTRVHKLIMIGTPNRGVTKFYIFTGCSGWSAAKVKSVGDDEPLGLWGVPTYCTDSGDALACCIYYSDDKPISPDRVIVRPTSEPHGKYPEEFPDQTSPPNGITYYSVFSGNTSTPYLGYVKPTAKHGETWYRWVSIKESMPGDGLVIESSAELPGVAISVPVLGATKLHAWLPADIEKLGTATY